MMLRILHCKASVGTPLRAEGKAGGHVFGDNIEAKMSGQIGQVHILVPTHFGDVRVEANRRAVE